MHYDLAILGAGAAGMIAAVAAAEFAHAAGAPLAIALFEKNTRPGIKVLVCGGGRCNFTNAGSIDFLIAQFGKSGRFLTPALTHLDNHALRQFFHDRNVPSHEERHGKIYPDSNQAKSVVDALLRDLHRYHVHIRTGPEGTVSAVASLPQPHPQNPRFQITASDQSSHTANIVLLALGGMSYQRMGTTGDGYHIARSLGHSLVTPRPAIVGLLVAESWPRELPGTAVPNVAVTVQQPAHLKSKIENRKSAGDILFTHFGLSGPAILNPSEIVARLLESSPEGVPLKVDFAPHLTHERLHALLRTWQQHHAKKLLRTMLSQSAPDVTITSTSPDQTAIEEPLENRTSETTTLSLPRRLAEKFCDLDAIPPNLPCSSLTASQIHHLIQRLKNSTFTATATRGFKEAMVTAGGIPLQEVNPETLESKIIPGLFLTGEILDLTGPSGGYNLQLAFSTGHLAGTAIARQLTQAQPQQPPA